MESLPPHSPFLSPLSELPSPSTDTLRQACDALGVDWVECAVSDFSSVARGKRVHRDDFVAMGGCRLPSVAFGLSLTGGEPADVLETMLPEGFADFHLVPDLQTLARRPGRPGEATVLCEPQGRWWSRRHGRSVDAGELSPRAVLRRVMDEAARQGLRATVAPELEFFLLSRRDEAGRVVLDSARAGAGAMARESACEAYSLERASHFDAYFDELYAACEALAIPVNGHAHEAALSQFEVNFRPGAPLAQADAVFRFKRLAREVAARHGFLASFAAKPFLDQPGTGMHWHFSLQTGDAAWPHLFAHPDGTDSAALGHFVAGLQSGAGAAMAALAPYDMSYDRIVHSDAAPSHATWGGEDRSLAFRVPTSGPASRRVENRLPGGDANPYLSVAITLGLGLAGLAAARTPLGGLHPELLLPRDLGSALAALESSAALRHVLGDVLVDVYAGIKRHEHTERQALADPRGQWDLVHLIELA